MFVAEKLLISMGEMHVVFPSFISLAIITIKRVTSLLSNILIHGRLQYF